MGDETEFSDNFVSEGDQAILEDASGRINITPNEVYNVAEQVTGTIIALLVNRDSAREGRADALLGALFKIIIGCVIEDDKVPMDDVTEAIEAFEDEVQSVDIAAFNKL